MTKQDGRSEHDRKGIADVFADFYETLYAQTHIHNDTDTTTTNNDNETTTPPFTDNKLSRALKQLKNGRSKDRAGIVAVMLKNGGAILRQTLLDL